MSEVAASRRSRYARELTSLALAPLLIWTVGWAPDPFYIGFIALIVTLALYEFLVLGEKKGYPVQKTLSIVLVFVLLGAFVRPEISVELGVVATLLLIPAFYVIRPTSDLEHTLPATAVSVLGILYVGMLGGALLRLRMDFDAQGPKLVFFLLLVVWLGDAGAYYTGRRFGKHKLSPRISPKKTVEGLIGGILTSLVAGAVIHITFFREFPLPPALLAAAILGFSGVVGDLAESMWKRSAAVKDSGALIPGHGGFLDRSDSILFTAPILYAYWFVLQNGISIG